MFGYFTSNLDNPYKINITNMLLISCGLNSIYFCEGWKIKFDVKKNPNNFHQISNAHSDQNVLQKCHYNILNFLSTSNQLFFKIR